MSNGVLVIFCRPGPGVDRRILGLTGVHRSIQGLARVGFDQIALVPRGDVADLAAFVPADFKDSWQAVPPIDGETDGDLIRRVAAGGRDAVVLDSDVVVGPKDAQEISRRVIGGRSLVVGKDLVHAFAGQDIANFTPGRTLAKIASDLRVQGRLDKLSPPLLVTRVVDDKKTIKDIGDLLVQGLLKPVDIDGVVGYYIQRPVTTRVSRLLVWTPVKPNHLTLLAMFVGILSGFLVAKGGYLLTALGGFLFMLGSFIDCLDGEIARLKFQFSKFGEWLDTVADDSSTLSFLLGMTIQLSGTHNSTLLAGLGYGAATVYVLASAYVYHYLYTVVGSGDLTRYPHPFDGDDKSSFGALDVLKYVSKRDFFSAFFCLCACLGILEVAFGFSVIGMFVFASVVAYGVWVRRAAGAAHDNGSIGQVK